MKRANDAIEACSAKASSSQPRAMTDALTGSTAAASCESRERDQSLLTTELAVRAMEQVRRLGATADRPLPADLATASGSGLDPHISLAGALFQVDRVAAVRQVDAARVRTLVEKLAFPPGSPLALDPVVNVLELNLALDQACSAP